WNQLQNGMEIKIGERTIFPEQVLGEKRSGKKIGISGDTMPTKELEKFFEDCDYLVFDSTFLEEIKEKAEETCHSTAKQAAELGKNAKVKNLILTHFSARYKDEIGHLEEAKKIHDSVITAKDFLEIEIR
ncbi:MAG: MBL fold metallo-hydrolase, partial [Nitrososphaeraceae archaeon]|nr:MBL fold metallo-hydrolase [Nitrososphaeraceae archaeon]